jgi:hypothetical protein
VTVILGVAHHVKCDVAATTRLWRYCSAGRKLPTACSQAASCDEHRWAAGPVQLCVAAAPAHSLCPAAQCPASIQGSTSMRQQHHAVAQAIVMMPVVQSLQQVYPIAMC